MLRPWSVRSHAAWAHLHQRRISLNWNRSVPAKTEAQRPETRGNVSSLDPALHCPRTLVQRLAPTGAMFRALRQTFGVGDPISQKHPGLPRPERSPGSESVPAMAKQTNDRLASVDFDPPSPIKHAQKLSENLFHDAISEGGAPSPPLSARGLRSNFGGAEAAPSEAGFRIGSSRWRTQRAVDRPALAGRRQEAQAYTTPWAFR